MSNNNINLNITIDDKQAKNSLTDIGAQTVKLNNQVEELEQSFDKAFDTKPIDDAEKAVKDVNKELSDTDKQLKRTNAQAQKTTKGISSGFRSAGRNIRRFSQGLRGAFARTGIGVFLIALGSLISGFGEFKNKVLDALGPVGDFIRDLISQTRDFLSVITFGIISSTATVIEELEKQRQEIVKSTKKITDDVLKLEAEAAVRRAELAGASEEELARLREEATKAEIEGLGNRATEIIKQINLLAARRDRIEGEIRRATAKGNSEGTKQLVKELQIQLAETEKALAEERKAQEENRVAILNIKAAEENARIELERKASEERKRVRDRESAQAKIDAADAARREKQRLDKEVELRLLFLLDEELAQDERIRNRARAREEEAKEIIKDAELLNQILLGIREQRDKELKELADKREKARNDEAAKARQAQFRAAQQALKIQQEGEEARLRLSEANQQTAFESVERTENDIKQFESQIQKEREEQALRFEKQRLQLLLEFGDLRTDAEKENIQTLIDAIDAEINGLKNTIQTASEDQPEGGFLARILGLDGEQQKEVEKAINSAIDNVNKLLDTRISALDAEIDAREKNLDRLNNILSAEQALLEAGEAANVRGTLDQIEQEEKAREEALKKQKQALIAKQTIDAVTQTSSLITASAQIFQSLSPIPFVGIPLAISTIALMFGSFAAAQAQAFSSINTQRLNTGGRIMNGEKDTNGGKGNRIEGTNLVVGRGEWVINADASEEHNDFLDALNRGDYDGVNLNKLMSKRTVKSIKTTENKAKKAYNKKVQQSKNRAIETALFKQTNVLHSDLVGIHNKPSIAATEDGYIIRHDLQNGNSITKKVKTK